MADLSLEWHDDFQVDSSGDLMVIDGDDEVRQRIERRLFTAMQGYVWHPEYGAGLPQRIGDPMTVASLKSIVASQIALEASVATNPAPQLFVSESSNSPGQFNIGIKYWDAVTGESVSFSITT